MYSKNNSKVSRLIRELGVCRIYYRIGFYVLMGRKCLGVVGVEGFVSVDMHRGIRLEINDCIITSKPYKPWWPVTFSNSLSSTEHWWKKPRIASKLKRGYDNTKSNAPYEDWMVLVEDYSDRSLTQGMDKLTALSGLARMICDTPITTREQRSSTSFTPRREVCTTVDNYVAGLWRKHFVHDLTWRTIKPRLLAEKSQLYRAPSWSWASIDGSIRFDYRRRIRLYKMFPARNPKLTVKIDCTINETVCKNILRSDLTSGVLEAHTTLTGPLVEVDLVTLNLTLSRRLWKPKEAL